MPKIGVASSTAITTSAAAASACARVSAATTTTGWPRYDSWSSARKGSSWKIGPKTLGPVRAAAVQQPATPGMAAAWAKSMPVMRPAATGEPAKATNSSPSVRGRSSM